MNAPTPDKTSVLNYPYAKYADGLNTVVELSPVVEVIKSEAVVVVVSSRFLMVFNKFIIYLSTLFAIV